ncbi:MAG: pyridoxal 5'-phosphate synthase glutaminase subunit PdxT [Ruminobacter sp.]|uniref:pyridoxal 5'-phosphate synthase glutaminase subunit PdxT n=1 Tax=Ruminobacter sp. TaxID=2774296 RepID=UPI001B52251E|nr:pyridoxal 5'-phosphate synthase glutaminase subunit PdxT [Ruminobacter sp.]MBP3749767.1 pyridoxal 5'-phosphate synthase glutaminase subunit PdxT [Ruminobacter sp.]
MKIGVLALQGAFREHEDMIRLSGAECIEIRQLSDLTGNSLDGIVLPGGESTVQGKLLRELGMLEPLRNMIKAGTPVLATCAGLILLAEKIDGDPISHLGTLPVTVKRNAFGRQTGSFEYTGNVGKLRNFLMTFIRAPIVTELHSRDVEVLAESRDQIVAVKYGNQIGLAFHPEINDDPSIHRKFLELCEKFHNSTK